MLEYIKNKLTHIYLFTDDESIIILPLIRWSLLQLYIIIIKNGLYPGISLSFGIVSPILSLSSKRTSVLSGSFMQTKFFYILNL